MNMRITLSVNSSTFSGKGPFALEGIGEHGTSVFFATLDEAFARLRDDIAAQARSEAEHAARVLLNALPPAAV